MNYKGIKYLVISLTTLLIIFSCSKDELRDEINFVNDSTKIGIETSDYDLGIKFNAPKNWDLQPASLSRKVESNSNDSFIYQPIYLFFDTSTKSIFVAFIALSADQIIDGAVNVSITPIDAGVLTSLVDVSAEKSCG